MARPERGCAGSVGRRADEERIGLPRRSDLLRSLRQSDQASSVTTSSSGQQTSLTSQDRLRHTEQPLGISAVSSLGREAGYAQLTEEGSVLQQSLDSAGQLTAVHNSLCFHNLESGIGQRDAATRAEDAASERKNGRRASDVLGRQLFEACGSVSRRQTCMQWNGLNLGSRHD